MAGTALETQRGVEARPRLIAIQRQQCVIQIEQRQSTTHPIALDCRLKAGKKRARPPSGTGFPRRFDRSFKYPKLQQSKIVQPVCVASWHGWQYSWNEQWT